MILAPINLIASIFSSLVIDKVHTWLVLKITRATVSRCIFGRFVTDWKKNFADNCWSSQWHRSHGDGSVATDLGFRKHRRQLHGGSAHVHLHLLHVFCLAVSASCILRVVVMWQ